MPTFTFSDPRITFTIGERCFFSDEVVQRFCGAKTPALRVTCNHNPSSRVFVPVEGEMLQPCFNASPSGSRPKNLDLLPSKDIPVRETVSVKSRPIPEAAQTSPYYPAVTNADLRGLGEFILDNAPWARKYLQDYATELKYWDQSGFNESYQPNKIHGWSLYAALRMAAPALDAINPMYATTDLYYVDSNMDMLEDAAMFAKDIREFCWVVFGDYSSQLARTVCDRAEGVAINELSILTLFHGLPPEKIVNWIENHNLWDLTRTLAISGMTIPTWFSAAPVHRRLRWLEDPEFLSGCLSLSQRHTWEGVEFGPDISKVFEEMAAQVPTDQVEEVIPVQRRTLWSGYESDVGFTPYVFTRDQEPLQEDGLTVVPMTSLSSLEWSGWEMDICVGYNKKYREDFMEGTAQFYRVVHGDQQFMLEMESTGRSLEFRGINDAEVPPESRELINTIREHYYRAPLQPA